LRLTQLSESLAISDLCRAEFIAAISMHVRMRRYPAAIGHALIDDFETWAVANTNTCQIEPADTSDAAAFLRRFDLKLRTPDAIHLGICRRLGARLLSYDVDQVAAALDLGIRLA